MANVKLNRKEIEKRIKLTPEILDRIMMLGIPVESLDEENLEIQILPNRPDLISVQGFLRALESFLGINKGLKKYKIKKPEKNYKINVDSSVSNVRPYTVCSIVKNLRLDDSKIKVLIDLQEKLHGTIGRNRKKSAIGIYPLDKISLPIKYEARKPLEIKFKPLEAKEEMNALHILQRHPTGKEYAKLLEGMEKFPVFVDSKNKILSMPPIINSDETGRITTDTKEVFIECSGSDIENLKKILNIIVTTLSDMGGEIYSMEIKYGKNIIVTPDLTPEKMKISIDNLNKKIGFNLKEKDLEKLLPKMGYDYSNGRVSIPAWRTDIISEVDLIEDIAIAYGYENLNPEIPQISTIGEESRESVIKSKISEILSGLGLIETSSYHLIKKDEISDLEQKEIIELENSKTDYKYLRPNLLIPSLRILSENKDNEYPQKIFEIGKTFIKDLNFETGIKEIDCLSISSSPSNFTEMKQILDYLIKMLDMNYEIKESSKKGLIDGRTGSIILGGKEIGYLGEVHPENLLKWGIKMPVSVIEISLKEIIDSYYPK